MCRISVELVGAGVIVLVHVELYERSTTMILFLSSSRNRMLSLIRMTRILI